MYFNKYLKYKKKYLNLKNIINYQEDKSIISQIAGVSAITSNIKKKCIELDVVKKLNNKNLKELTEEEFNKIKEILPNIPKDYIDYLVNLSKKDEFSINEIIFIENFLESFSSNLRTNKIIKKILSKEYHSLILDDIQFITRELTLRPVPLIKMENDLLPTSHTLDMWNNDLFNDRIHSYTSQKLPESYNIDEVIKYYDEKRKDIFLTIKTIQEIVNVVFEEEYNSTPIINIFEGLSEISYESENEKLNVVINVYNEKIKGITSDEIKKIIFINKMRMQDINGFYINQKIYNYISERVDKVNLPEWLKQFKNMFILILIFAYLQAPRLYINVNRIPENQILNFNRELDKNYVKKYNLLKSAELIGDGRTKILLIPIFPKLTDNLENQQYFTQGFIF